MQRFGSGVKTDITRYHSRAQGIVKCLIIGAVRQKAALDHYTQKVRFGVVGHCLFIHLCKRNCGVVYSVAGAEGEEMKKTGPIKVLGLWISPVGDRAEAAEIVTDGDEIIDLGHSEIVKLSKTESTSLAIGGAQSAFVAEDLAGTLFERFQGIDLVGFQGPILAFEQGINLHEAGSGAVLAEAFDTPVVWDLLSEDFALNGASVLASQAEWSAALMRRMKEMGPVVHICLDARSQVFWVREGKLILATEAGPTMEFLLAKKAGVRGNIASGIPEQFVAGGFNSKMGPRSSGQELSERAAMAVQKLSAADARATAAAIVVAGVLQTLEQGPYVPERVFVSGPVAADRDIASMLAAAINVPLESLGVNAMQAGGIGFVAARIVRGKTVTGPHVTGVPTTMSAGTLSRPSLS